MDCCGPGLMLDAPTRDALFYLTTGLLMSLGHCTGMCGPLVAAYANAQCRACPGLSTPRQVGSFLTYHAGRVTTYAAIGLAFGMVGQASQLTGSRWFQGGLSLGVGSVMLLLGLGLIGFLPTQRWVESGTLGTVVIGRMRGLLAATSPTSRFAMGMANGLLPCGPVYAMAIGTLAAPSPWLGAGAMALFGLGTVPVLVVLGLGAGRIGPRLQRRFNRLGAVVVLLLAVQLGLRGAAALGWVGHLRWGEFVVW
ncbi:MAG: sulfite exporter TauE/SafE family protein [Candidatus Krumholzibacteriia bacterium]